MNIFSDSVVRNIRALLYIKKRYKRKKAFSEFFSNHYRLSGAPIYSPKELDENNMNYDVYVTGSDQTFNLLLGGNVEERKTYFLPFVNKHKKISYASSMGEKILELDDENRKWMKKALSSYDKVLVREKVAADFIESLGLERPEITIDPTLLLQRDDWDKIEKETNYEKGKYILFYSVLSEPWVIEKVNKIADELNLKVVAPHYKNRYEKFTHFVRAEECGPCEFISLIKNAAFICTTSFHGTVFSILYNKPFLSFILGEGNRINNLLNIINMKDRAVHKEDEPNISDSLNIDYERANELLEKERIRSIEYLKTAIDQ